MTDRDQAVAYSANGDHGRPGRLAAFTEFAVPADQPADVAAGLVSLGYIWAAIGRRKRLWAALSVLGLLVGLGYYAKEPPSYKAEASVLLRYMSDEDPSTAVNDYQAMAESHTVAQAAMNSIGDHESLGSFARSYTVTEVTQSILQITASASSPSLAVSKANAVAKEFLKIRATLEENAQNLQTAQMQNQLGPDTQQVASLQSQLSKARAEPTSPAQQARVKSLQTQENQANLNLETLNQQIANDKTGSEFGNSVTGSVVLDPAAALPRSKAQSVFAYAAYGLIGGLVLGLGIVVISAIVSDRLRRRDDVARALGAPVKLSVGGVRLGRKRTLEAAGNADIQRIVAHLREELPAGGKRSALAVVPVGDPGVAALSLVSLAIACARDGLKVVVTDMASGVPAAKLLGGGSPGAEMMSVEQTLLMLVVPEADDIAPRCPFDSSAAAVRSSRLTEAAVQALRTADVLLTLATLDPAVGGEHLATWADRAVAVVTAGHSSWTTLQSAAEMIRSGGAALVSAVLVGTDKSDRTLGLAPDRDALLGIGGFS